MIVTGIPFAVMALLQCAVACVAILDSSVLVLASGLSPAPPTGMRAWTVLALDDQKDADEVPGPAFGDDHGDRSRWHPLVQGTRWPSLFFSYRRGRVEIDSDGCLDPCRTVCHHRPGTSCIGLLRSNG